MTDHCPLTTDNCSLFPDLGPTIEERIKEIDLEIERLLYGGQVAGVSLSDDEKRILGRIRYRRGAANAIPIAQIRSALANIDGEFYGFSDREVKGIVRTLRIQFRLPIGSNKGNPGGYYIMISPEDHAILRSQILDQVRAELAVLKATSGPYAARELLGQLRIEAESQEAR